MLDISHVHQPSIEDIYFKVELSSKTEFASDSERLIAFRECFLEELGLDSYLMVEG